MSKLRQPSIAGQKATPPGTGERYNDRAMVHRKLDEVIDRVEETAKLTDMVTLLMAALREIGLLILRTVLMQRDERLHEGRSEAPSCPQCGQRMHKPRKTQVSRNTLLGRLRYQRRCWLCSNCHKSHSPLDATLGLILLHHGHSLEFVKALSLLCVLHAFGEGCNLFEKCFGWEVSTHLAYRLVMGIGTELYEQEMKRARELWEQRLTNPEMFEPTPAKLRKMERASRLYMMMDNSKGRIQEGKRGRNAPKRKKGKSIEERFNLHAPKRAPVLLEDSVGKKHEGTEDWRDVRAVLVYRERDVAQVSKGRRQILRRRVLAHVGTLDEFRQLLHMVFHDEGVYVAHQVVVVADGGAGIWELIEELLPSTSTRRVTEVLDWCHAVSHLWTVAKKWKPGKASAQVSARTRWVDGLVKYLAEGKVCNVLQRLRRLQGAEKKTKELQEELSKCIDYFTKHRGRMKYGQYRKEGLTIGSGAIESVNKWVVQARCKQSGMAWSEAGLNAMLRLRCAWASGKWDDVFKENASAVEQKLNVCGAAA